MTNTKRNNLKARGAKAARASASAAISEALSDIAEATHHLTVSDELYAEREANREDSNFNFYWDFIDMVDGRKLNFNR